MNKYPIFIVSKGRADTSLTAKCFIEDGVPFRVLVEPQEYDAYCAALGKQYIQPLPFANLGLGSYPARNHAWELALKMGAERHWVFDDNIRGFRRLHKGKKIPCSSKVAIHYAEDFTDRYTNIAISGFQYSTFSVPQNSGQKPLQFNCHCYSAMLIKCDMPYRWRLKYNEDVDLCLQVLHNKLCTVLFMALLVDKTSTVAKMKGGNQDELYKGNAYEKKVLKARSLEEIWPQYVKTKMRFNRPHHWVDWAKEFNHPLIRRSDIDWNALAQKKIDVTLRIKGNVQSQSLKRFIESERNVV